MNKNGRNDPPELTFSQDFFSHETCTCDLDLTCRYPGLTRTPVRSGLRSGVPGNRRSGQGLRSGGSQDDRSISRRDLFLVLNLDNKRPLSKARHSGIGFEGNPTMLQYIPGQFERFPTLSTRSDSPSTAALPALHQSLLLFRTPAVLSLPSSQKSEMSQHGKNGYLR